MNFQQVAFESSYGKSSQLPPSDRPEIAFAGRSNVGKSSLINKVFNRKQLARVSATPGKTTTVNFFSGGKIRFADLPGYGYAKVAKTEKERWSELMEAYFQSGRQIALVFQLVDMRHPPTSDDLSMMEFLNQVGFPFAVVLTKADKLSKQERIQQEAVLEEALAGIKAGYRGTLRMIPFSAKTGEGAEEIRGLINEMEASLTGGQS